MKDVIKYIEDLYQNFNDRNIDLVLANLSTSVKWANGMEGGHVYGRDGVKDYWTRQFSLISPKVIPIDIKNENGTIMVKVHQVVHDLNGNLLSDEITEHIFYLDNGQISEFGILKK